MRVAIVPGHTLTGVGTGASGYINEGRENRILTDLIVKWLKIGGATVFTGRIDNSSNYLAEQVAIANRQSVDVAVQIHFNAYKTVSYAMGTETLYDRGSTKGKAYAVRVNDHLNNHFKNRGAKERNDLYWLNATHAPAILIETCFCDSKADTDIYNANKDGIAKSIAEGILGKSISAPQPPTGGGGTETWYRAVAISDPDRAEVEKAIADLKANGYPGAWLMAFQKEK